MNSPSISIVTTTFNVAGVLPTLVGSLRAQTDRDFEWVVVDGASTDATTRLIESADDVVTQWVSEPDCGIYDAMNKAIGMMSGDYYLVCGADDMLFPDAIENYRKWLRSHPGCDLIVAGVQVGDKVRMGYRAKRYWLGHTAMFSHHSVGTLIRRGLHEEFGRYDLNFRVLADGYFLKKVAKNPHTKIVSANFVAGEFFLGGASGAFLPRTLSELWVIQLLTEPHPFFQTMVHLLRLVRYGYRIRRDCLNRQKTIAS
jgi:glycosyltransferase involved in cell wall biosynthesis